MEFVFSREQDELRAMVRAFCEDNSPESEVRRLMATAEGFDVDGWRRLAALGLTGLSIPEEYGGAGCGPIEVGIVMEEAGASLLCAPYLSSVVLATEALLAAGDDAACEQYLPGLAGGSLRATAAFADARNASTVQVVSTRSGHRLTGVVSQVLDGVSADVVLVTAESADGLSLYAVDGSAQGVRRAHHTTMDATRKQARLTFDEVQARLIGRSGTADAVLARLFDIAATQLAAEQVGGAQHVLDMAVEYAKLRVQFGRPIGSFQAIKHKCADMLLRVESARSAAYHALWAAAEARPDFAAAASVAGTYCSQAFYHCAEENILIHGGIGYTWEHSAHLYFKRAVADRVMFGEPAQHREAIAARLGM